jgi:predicted nucleic acid-binding protein
VVSFGVRSMDPDATSAAEQSIEQLWVPAAPTTLADITEPICREAREIARQARRQGLQQVTSTDALHLASARLNRCAQFFTYEDEKTRGQWTELTGMPVSEPSVAQPPLGAYGPTAQALFWAAPQDVGAGSSR